jgi:hypothetical protein
MANVDNSNVSQTLIQNPIIFDQPLGKLDRLNFKIYLDDDAVTPAWLYVPTYLDVAEWNATFQIDEEIGYASVDAGWSEKPSVPIPEQPSQMPYIFMKPDPVLQKLAFEKKQAQRLSQQAGLLSDAVGGTESAQAEADAKAASAVSAVKAADEEAAKAAAEAAAAAAANDKDAAVKAAYAEAKAEAAKAEAAKAAKEAADPSKDRDAKTRDAPLPQPRPVDRASVNDNRAVAVTINRAVAMPVANTSFKMAVADTSVTK